MPLLTPSPTLRIKQLLLSLGPRDDILAPLGHFGVLTRRRSQRGLGCDVQVHLLNWAVDGGVTG